MSKKVATANRLLQRWSGGRSCSSASFLRGETNNTIRQFSSSSKPKAVFLNASRLNYDDKLDFSEWHKLVDVTLNDADRVDDPARVIELVLLPAIHQIISQINNS